MNLSSGPRVFVSYASPDETSAARLVSDLGVLGIETFFGQRDVQPGENVPLRISENLQQSDYFVLLVSLHTVNRNWVDAEWSMAFMHEINERRAFLFVLRLDDTALPLILAARHYLDAFRDWNRAVERLAETWKRDWDLRKRAIGVLPAPGLADFPLDAEWGLYVFNSSLSVEHFLRASPRLSCRQLQARVHAALRLQDVVSILDGRLGMRFSYQLVKGSSRLAPELLLPDAGIEDDTVLNLIVDAEPFGPSQPAQSVTFRTPGGVPLTKAFQRDLLLKAFNHLRPWS